MIQVRGAGWRTRLVAGLAAATVLVATELGCSSPAERPGAVLDMQLTPTVVPHGGVLEMSYQLSVGVLPPSEDPYRVFVHFLDPKGRLLWDDDHLPPAPLSRVRPGTLLSYHRTIFVPASPYVGEVTIVGGVYAPGSPRAVPLLDQDMPGGRRLARLHLLTQSAGIPVGYRTGWHEPALPPRASSGRWTEPEWEISFPNPREDVTLYLELGERPDLAGAPTELTVASDGRIVATATLDTAGRGVHRLPLRATDLGSTDPVALRLRVGRPYVPETARPDARDGRRLGVRVLNLAVQR